MSLFLAGIRLCNWGCFWVLFMFCWFIFVSGYLMDVVDGFFLLWVWVIGGVCYFSAMVWFFSLVFVFLLLLCVGIVFWFLIFRFVCCLFLKKKKERFVCCFWFLCGFFFFVIFVGAVWLVFWVVTGCGLVFWFG